MDYVKLGSTGLDVSPICLGCMTFGEPGQGYPSWTLPEVDSELVIKSAVEAGINFFDTANGYSDGSSEEILGRAVAKYANRDDVVIATKVLHPMRPGHPNSAGLSRKAILTEVEASLRRLGTDYIDLYQIHRFDPGTPLEETLDTLNDLVHSGKVRYLGASSMHAWQFSKALHLQSARGYARFVTMQDHYNLLNREEEREMIPLCADEGVGVLVWSPLARGLLAREWNDTSSHRAQADAARARALYHYDSDRAIADAVTAIARNRGVTRAQIALAWLHHNPVVTSPIIGASKPHHLDDAIASIDIRLTDDEIRQLEAPYTPRENIGF